eukprot:503443_1
MVVTSSRFIIGAISGMNKPINFKSLRDSIEAMVQDLWGIVGLSNLQIVSITHERIVSKKTTLIIIKCDRNSKEHIVTSLLFVDKLDGINIRWNTLHVAGSERLKSKFIESYSN